jgi:hypothetical protein
MYQLQLNSMSPFLTDFWLIVLAKALQRDVVYLGWPIAPSYMSPNSGERGVAGYQPMSTAVHRSPNNYWRSNAIFNLWFLLVLYSTVYVVSPYSLHFPISPPPPPTPFWLHAEDYLTLVNVGILTDYIVLNTVKKTLITMMVQVFIRQRRLTVYSKKHRIREGRPLWRRYRKKCTTVLSGGETQNIFKYHRAGLT